MISLRRAVSRSTFLLVTLVSVSTTHAIVIRHDRDDALYRAQAADHPEIVEIGHAHGTLIASDWVLTAAHVVDGWLSPLGGEVRVNGVDHAVKRVVFHPTWVGDLGGGMAQLDWIDMALLQLAEPVRDAVIAHPYRRDDEVGKQIVFVGKGRTGNGNTGPTTSDQQLRVATNRVERADDNWLYFTFDAPPAGTELEGISGPGDSGNAALMSLDGTRYILGVGSRNDYAGAGLEECVYGTVEVYSRVSPQINWIRRTMRQHSGPGMVRPISADNSFPDSPAGRLAGRFFKLYNAGDQAALTALAEEQLSAAERRILPPEEWGRLWADHQRRAGVVSPSHFVELRENKLVVLAAAGDHWKSYRFELEGTAPYRLRKVAVTRTTTVAGRPLPDPQAKTKTQEDES